MTFECVIKQMEKLLCCAYCIDWVSGLVLKTHPRHLVQFPCSRTAKSNGMFVKYLNNLFPVFGWNRIVSRKTTHWLTISVDKDGRSVKWEIGQFHNFIQSLWWLWDLRPRFIGVHPKLNEGLESVNSRPALYVLLQEWSVGQVVPEIYRSPYNSSMRVILAVRNPNQKVSRSYEPDRCRYSTSKIWIMGLRKFCYHI